MPPANLLEKFNNYIYKKFAKDMGASLIVLGVAGWTFSALGQLGMIALNKNIDKKEKKFLIPQEIADGVVNVTLFYTICAGIKKAVDSLLESGKILTFRTNNLVKEFRAGQSSVEDLIKAFSEELLAAKLVQKTDGGRISKFYIGMIKLLEGKDISLKDSALLKNILASEKVLQNKDRYINLLKKGYDEFQGYKIGLLHGKMSNVEKDEVMNDFKKGNYDILVSTTVVEVGVDNPNATVIVIENAERFGLSQLHQLRGRVGRGNEQSYCALITSSSSKDVRKRLEIMTKTNDGFVISQKDLELRGPGEFLGTRQSGLPDFRLADLVNDVEILNTARKYAFEFIENEDIEKYPLLKKEALSHNLFRG